MRVCLNVFVQVDGNNQVKLYILQFPNIISRIVHGVGRGWVAIVQDRGKPVSVLPLRRRALDEGQFHGVPPCINSWSATDVDINIQMLMPNINLQDHPPSLDNNNNNKEDDDTV